MAGGLLQLIAYGAQDIYLTDNPQITYFKVVYRRHTNFSVETFEHTVQDNPNFGTSNKIIIYRNGDLVTKMYLKIIINKVLLTEGEKFAWVRRLGHAVIDSVEVDIGGNSIDKHYGTWLDIWYELARTGDHESGYNKMIGDVSEMTKYNDVSKPEYTLFIPLKFWFNRHYGLALPMIGIQYQRVMLHIKFNPIEKLIVRNSAFSQTASLSIQDVTVLVDYVFLDTDERRRFAVKGSEYLIEQVQFTGNEGIVPDSESKRTQLHFNYPTKELFWCIKNGKYTSGNKFICYSNKNDWESDILDCSKQILLDSVVLLKAPITEIDDYGNEVIVVPGIDPPPGDWEEFEPGAQGNTSNNNIFVMNNSDTNSLWVNINSLTVGGYSITDKISGMIEVSSDPENIITAKKVSSDITVRDVSIPVSRMTDTRIRSDDVCVNQFFNYGTLIDGSVNPIQFSLLEFNDKERFPKRNGLFFNYLQPEMHHLNTPADGINVYSFALRPEQHQPTGTANFSKIENIIFTMWFGDSTHEPGLPNLSVTDENTVCCIFAFNYNILRVYNGLSGLAYNG